MDLYVKSSELLAALANSIHDRSSKLEAPFFFNTLDISVTEKWLEEFIKDLNEECVRF